MLLRIVSLTSIHYLLIMVEFVFALIFLFIVIAFYGESIPTGKRRAAGDVYFYVQTNGIHTEICVPSQTKYANWESFLPLDDYAEGTPHQFVSLGWGEKEFYLNTPEWGDLTLGTAFNAIVLPSPTAMHVTYQNEPTASATCQKIYVSAAEYKKLVGFIRKSFQKEGRVARIIPSKGYGMYDNFYEANASYHLFRTCNTWTNSALKTADVRTALLAIFPNGVMGHLK